MILPEICGVTVTDSKAPLRPISSRYTGTSWAVAAATVTSGADCGGPAAWVLFLAHPEITSKTASAAAAVISLLHFIQVLRSPPRDPIVLPTNLLEPVLVNDLVWPSEIDDSLRLSIVQGDNPCCRSRGTHCTTSPKKIQVI